MVGVSLVGSVCKFTVKSSLNRETKTPHSGYHFDGSDRRFFEGWYFKISIPEAKQSFAWMYSIEDPNSSKVSGTGPFLFEEKRFPGVGAQIMGADGEYLCQQDEKTSEFWGNKDELELGNSFRLKNGIRKSPKEIVSPNEFNSLVEEGFQVSPTFHQGFLKDNGRSSNLSKCVESARWEYTTKPIYGWGPLGGLQKSTAGWLAAFQVFEPHWQVCMAGGLSSGFVQWGEKIFEFENVPSYAEKNWGGSFPEKWFWVQCNVFEGVEGEMALTAGGGRRALPIIPFQSPPVEEVAMIGVHFKGQFYEFVPWNGTVSWKINQWGKWEMKGKNEKFEVELLAITQDSGTVLRAPTKDFGLAPFCKDSFKGELTLKIWEVNSSGLRGKLVLETSSDMAALEVGGGPWWTSWENSCQTPPILNDLVGLPLDLESLLPSQIRPPGL